MKNFAMALVTAGLVVHGIVHLEEGSWAGLSMFFAAAGFFIFHVLQDGKK